MSTRPGCGLVVAMAASVLMLSPAVSAAPKVGAGPGRASPVLAHKDSLRNLLILADFAAEPSPEQRELYELIHARVLLGARAGTRNEGSSYGDVLSFDQVKGDADLVKALRLIGPRYGRTMDREVRDVYTLSVGQTKGYLRPTVRQFEDRLQLDLELYERDEEKGGFRVKRMKSVSSPQTDKQQLLDLATDAARRIVLPALDDKVGGLSALATIAPAALVAVDTPVTLDALPSLHSEHDAIMWFWCQVEGPENVLPGSWVGRRRFDFVPTEAGQYVFALKIVKALEVKLDGLKCEAKGSKDDKSFELFTVSVRRKPVALPGASRLVETTFPPKPDPTQVTPEPTPATVEGSCRYCSRYRWRQTKGPSVQPTKRGSPCEPTWKELALWPGAKIAETSDVSCNFEAPRPGTYEFELTVGNEIGEDVKTTTIVVAPQPFVVLPPIRPLKADYLLRLDGRSSYDELDPAPRFRWDALYKQPDNCAPAPQFSEARVLSPTGQETAFVANKPGTYYARLTVEARRSLPDRELSSYACAATKIEVTRRRWTFLASFGLNTSKHLADWGDAGSVLSTRLAANVLLWRDLGLKGEYALYGFESSAKGWRGSAGGPFFFGPSLTHNSESGLSQFRVFGGPIMRIAQGEQQWGGELGTDLVLELGRGWGLVGTLAGWLLRKDAQGKKGLHGTTRLAGGVRLEF